MNKLLNNKKKKLLFLFVYFILLFPAVVFAQSAPRLQIDIGNFSSADFNPYVEGLDTNWLGQYVSALYTYGVGLAVVLAVVMIMAGGLVWLMSGGSPDKVGKGKEFITSAMTGLVLALFSFLILQTINPSLVSLKGINTGTILRPTGSGDSAANYNVPTGVTGGTVTGSNPDALSMFQGYIDNYGAVRTSGIRNDGSRHDPNEPGYVGNVFDAHYDPNSRLTQQITGSATRVEPLSWGTAYHQPDGSVWVQEPGGSTGYHWHIEFPAPGWTWQANRPRR